MKRILVAAILLMGLNGCEKTDTNEIVEQLIKDGKNFSYTTVGQGYFEETFYTATNVQKVTKEFDILNTFSEGDWNPVNALQLLDITTENVIHIKYVAVNINQYINIIIEHDGEIYFDEDFDLPEPIRVMAVKWNGREVYIRADAFEYALSIPFDVALIGSLVSSMEVINQIRTD